MKGTQSDVRFLLALLAVSLGINTFLAYRVLTANRMAPPPKPLVAGDSAPPLELKTLDGRLATLGYSEPARPTVLYVFAPSCGFCAANAENIRHLAKSTGGAFRFIGVSLSEKDLDGYLETHELGFPVYTVTPATQKAYGLGSVPQTLVVSESGKVLQSWMGAYRDEAEREVERYFVVNLPGLSQMPAEKAG
jgi:peroxiredoxin